MVDILLPTHNGEKYLNEQLNSLLEQTYNDFHIYIRDDCSVDKTSSIIEKYRAENPGRFTLLENKGEHLGAKDSFFELIKFSQGNYIMFCDQDDIWAKDKIESYLNIAKSINSEIPFLIHSDLAIIDQDGNELNSSMMKLQKLNPNFISLNRLLAQNQITGCTVMINKKLKQLIKNSKDALMHDWWIALIAAAFGKIIFFNKSTVLYRQHSANEVGAKNVASLSYIKDKLNNINNIKKSIHDTYKQALAFLNTYINELNEDNKILINEYLKLENSNRLIKIHSMIKNRFLKNGLMRKIGQMILG